MAQQEYPTLDGVAPSWADLEVTIPIYDGPTVKTQDIAALKWSVARERGEVRGTSGGRVRKRTRGQTSYEGTITFYKQGFRTMLQGLQERADALGLSILDIPFDVLAKHTTPELTGDVDIHEALMQGCLLDGVSSDMAEGVDADQIEVPLSIMLVVLDGVPL
jgi:hypothetical protein